MPLAAHANTGPEWARDRAFDLLVLFASDLNDPSVDGLAASFQTLRDDGVTIASVGELPDGYADRSVTGPFPPSPAAIFAAVTASGVEDMRKVAVLAASPATIEAAHRAGASTILGLVNGETARLVDAQPDLILEADDLGGIYAERFGTERTLRQFVLLNPGPSVVSDRVHRAVGGPDLCHREPEYTGLFERVRSLLLQVAGVSDDWALVLIAGSGTAAMEAMTLAGVRPGKKLLVCKNGIYGERIETIARRSGIDVVVVAADDLTPIDPSTVAVALDRDPAIDAVAVIHHETTTGLLNPVQEIAREADRQGVLTLCDAISSFGAEELTLAGSGIDFMASTSNKCLHGLPGVAFLLVSPRGQKRIQETPPRSLYFDLQGYLKAQAARSVPFTPAIPATYGLRAALEELLDEGVAARRRAYQERADFLDASFRRIGLEPRVAQRHRSRSVRSLPLPEGVEYAVLHDRVKQQGYVIYAGLGDASRTTFRVCALGALRIDALAGFFSVLEPALAEQALVRR